MPGLVALDYSSSALEIAKRIAAKEEASIDLTLSDANYLPFRDNSIDVVFSQGFVEHFKDPLPILKEQYRVLKNGGLLLVDVPQKFHLYTLLKHWLMALGKWPFGWETEYSAPQLQRLLASVGLDVVCCYGHGSLTMWMTRYLGIVKPKTRKQPDKSFVDGITAFWRRSLLPIYLGLNLGVVGKKPVLPKHSE